ncbi:MAG: S41 family peptidase [Chitinophagaceae bacterium]|nr:S41 family peptidase [Chitinophagaceae bacterium]
MTVNKKLKVWQPLLFSLVLIAGMLLGYKLGDRAGNGKGLFSGNRKNPLQEALYLIRNHYVDSVNMDSIQGYAIQEMMDQLDPHSVYLPPVDLKEANEELSGNFEGIGVEFNLFRDTVHVVTVLPGGPSEKAGLKVGDQLLGVNDSSLTRKGFTVAGIKSLIRGPRGSEAVLDVLRDKKHIQVTVIRGRIPVPSVDAAYMIDKTTGYLKLTKFTETSYEEFMQSMETLQQSGMKSLVFDLRGNGGGFMNEAVDMADEFLDGDKLIVYTEGYNSKKREYRCKRPGLFEKGKLVLLVDELSASASEVLAGALQDWCRATIIGRRTFGKGLVQEQHQLHDGSAIRLTVARYYTPLGRSIQRPYEKGRKVYMEELWERFSNGEMSSADSVKSHNGNPYTTLCNDTLYGGGGITPGIFIPIDTSASLQKANRATVSADFNNFIYTYYLQHKNSIDKMKSPADFLQGYPGNDDLWRGLSGASLADSVPVTSFNTAEKEMVLLRLKGLLARYRWRNTGYYQVVNSADPMVLKALEVLK